jgi:hypothetical protein
MHSSKFKAWKINAPYLKNDQPNDKIIDRALSRWEKKRKKQKFKKIVGSSKTLPSPQ